MENWKIIEQAQGYEVSTLGRVRNIGTGKVLKLCNRGGGYRCVTLAGSGENATNIHRLVAIAFIPNPDNKPYVNHINEIKSDNRVYNLEWVTASENSKHSAHKCFKEWQSAKKVRCKQTDKTFESSYKAAMWVDDKMFKGSKPIKNIASNIRKACNGTRRKTAWGFTWEYID